LLSASPEVIMENLVTAFFFLPSIDLGYSIKLHETFSLGLRLNLRYGSSTQSGLWATSGVLGGFYSPSPGISYGIVFDGIGLGVLYKNIDYKNSVKYERLKQNLRIGLLSNFLLCTGRHTSPYHWKARR